MAKTGYYTHAGSVACPVSRPMHNAWGLLPLIRGLGAALYHNLAVRPRGLCASKYAYRPHRHYRCVSMNPTFIRVRATMSSKALSECGKDYVSIGPHTPKQCGNPPPPLKSLPLAIPPPLEENHQFPP